MTKWIKGGASPNPGGRPCGTSHWQRPADRIRYWLQKPVGEINALYGDGEALQTMSVMDAMIVSRVINSLKPEGCSDFEKLLSRAFGTPEASSKLAMIVGTVTQTTSDRARQAEQEAQAMLAKLCGGHSVKDASR